MECRPYPLLTCSSLAHRLSETRLSCDLDIEQEGQTEIVAEQEAVYQNLSGMDLDVKRW